MNLQLKNSDFAILYRTNAQSRAIEEALRKKDLKYKIFGGLSFYQRKEIKDLLGYFRLVLNPNDEEAFKRVVNYPARGIGKTTQDKLRITATNNERSIWEIASNLNAYNTGIGTAAQTKLNEFIEMIKSFRKEVNTKDAYEIGQAIASTAGILKEYYTDKTPEGISKYENIQELLNALKEFSEQQRHEEPDKTPLLENYMSNIALLTDADEKDKKGSDYISLMTIHAAKGLEFPYVHIVGLEENLFPSQMSLSSRPDLEEERRLFYVALTRAEKGVTLSYATNRYKWGNLIYCEPSRFLEEIDDTFVELHDKSQRGFLNIDHSSETKKGQKAVASFSQPVQGKKPQRLVKIHRNNPANIPENSSTNNNDIEVGNQVKHHRFGIGVVLEIEGDPANRKAKIEFNKFGTKQLLLRFAKLEVL